MIKIEKFAVNVLETNCYVVSDESGDCVIIDCGAQREEEQAKIAAYISENNLHPVHLLATHGHIDHNFGNAWALDNYGLKVEVHERDEELLKQADEQYQQIFGATKALGLPEIGQTFTEDDVITFGNHQFSIIETPGHSRGGVFFYCKEEKVAFSGDTLFRGSIGRTDFMGGSMFQIIQSLRQICQLPDEVQIYPGHGPSTTIGYECATNMYIDR